MCGICGVWSPGDTSAHLKTQLLLEQIQHRGPDDFGLIESDFDQLAFGHHRLSIIDVEGSKQPMTSINKRFTIVFNGEIYNYKDLRTRLQYPFQTDGDTETLLALWEKEGSDCISKLRGQFAFSIWDSEKKEISLVTDAFGILPLYVYEKGSTLAFSSSASSLANNFPEIQKDSFQIENLLTTRAIIAPETVYMGIRRLPPGALWTYQQDKKQEKNWNPSWNEIKVAKSSTHAV